MLYKSSQIVDNWGYIKIDLALSSVANPDTQVQLSFHYFHCERMFIMRLPMAASITAFSRFSSSLHQLTVNSVARLTQISIKCFGNCFPMGTADNISLGIYPNEVPLQA